MATQSHPATEVVGVAHKRPTAALVSVARADLNGTTTVRLVERYEPATVESYPVRSGPLHAGEVVRLPTPEAQALIAAGAATAI